MIPGVVAGGMKGSTGAWTPAQVSPTIWLNDDSTATDAGSGACSQWNDISGNSRHATQATSASRPLIVSGGLNSRRIIRFDGSNDWMICDYEILLTAVACYVVYSTASSNQRIVDQRGAGAFGGTITGWHLKTPSGGQDSCGADDGATHYRSLSNVGATNGANVYGFDYSAGTIDCYLNGTSVGVLGSAGTMGSIATTKRIYLGANVNGQDSQIFSGDLAEVVIVGSALGTTSRQKLEGYLAHRWGLAASLPAGHPYKSAPP